MSEIVGYDGACPICYSGDGTIIKGEDGRFRNMCRVMGCPAMYVHAPAVGFDTAEDCRNPFDTDYLKSGSVTVENMPIHYTNVPSVMSQLYAKS